MIRQYVNYTIWRRSSSLTNMLTTLSIFQDTLHVPVQKVILNTFYISMYCYSIYIFICIIYVSTILLILTSCLIILIYFFKLITCLNMLIYMCNNFLLRTFNSYLLVVYLLSRILFVIKNCLIFCSTILFQVWTGVNVREINGYRLTK